MTTPISNAQSYFYDPEALICRENACAPTDATCGAPPAATSPSPHVVTIDPVVITGDAAVQQLVKQLDGSPGRQDCSFEANQASQACGKVLVAAASTLAAAPTVAGALVGIGATFLESVSCGQNLRAYYDCETQ
jgi:hypothetical protein